MRLTKTVGTTAIAALAAMAILGVFSAKAVETTYHYYRCLRNANAMYIESTCKVVGALAQWERAPFFGSPVNVNSAGKSEFTIDVGKSTHIGCEAETGAGTAWNPEPFETKNGEGKTKMTFEGCVVSKPASCALPGKKFATSELSAALEESKSFGIGVKLSPVKGETFAELNLGKECPTGEKVVIKGSTFGIEGKLVEFTEGSSSLTAGAEKVIFKGTLAQKDEEGNTVLIAP